MGQSKEAGLREGLDGASWGKADFGELPSGLSLRVEDSRVAGFRERGECRGKDRRNERGSSIISWGTLPACPFRIVLKRE